MCFACLTVLLRPISSHLIPTMGGCSDPPKEKKRKEKEGVGKLRIK